MQTWVELETLTVMVTCFDGQESFGDNVKKRYSNIERQTLLSTNVL